MRVLTASFLTIGVTIYSLNKEIFGVGTNIIKCKNWLSIIIKNLFNVDESNVDETKSFCQLNVYVPALVCDAIGVVYKALKTSSFMMILVQWENLKALFRIKSILVL